MRKEAHKNDEEHTINNVEIVNADESARLVYVKIKLYGHIFYGMIDTSATMSAISISVIKKL